jgi:glycosyltransferase involved in cell wall biosynthesis
MKRASCAFTICDSMSEAYAPLFGIRCHTLYTASEPRAGRDTFPKSGPISYAGTLGHGRHQSIMAVGEALSRLALPDGPREICVYSAESRPEILSELQAAKGVRFCGRLSAEGVERVMRESVAVLHAESFDEKETARVRFSVSTKIADSLMNGPCLIAYGPEGIASIDYLRAHQAAWVISDPDALEAALYRILTEPALRAETVARARALAQANHRADEVSAKVRAWLQEVIEA